MMCVALKVSLLNMLKRLIYNRKYDIIDSHMSDSNIGACRGKSSRNHTWVINGIKYETYNSRKSVELLMQSYNYMKMYDSMSLNITMSDLYDNGVKDDLLKLLYEVKKKT